MKNELIITLDDFKLIKSFCPEFNRKGGIETNDFIIGWAELMPVVEKIESIYDDHHGYFGVHISSNECTIQGTYLRLFLDNSDYGRVYMSDPNAILSTKIKTTYYNVVQFIKWYSNKL